MRIPDARDFSVKLFGIYCLISFVVIAPTALSMFFLSDSATEFIRSMSAQIFLMALPALLYLGLAYFFLFRTDTAVRLIWGKTLDSEDAFQKILVANYLSFWIVLIGVFYFIKSSAGVLSQLWIFAAKREMIGSYLSFRFLPQIIILPLSILCILKSRAIEKFIQRKTNKDTQPAPEVDAS